MKHIKHITSVGNNGVTIKLTIEINTAKGYSWRREDFIHLMDHYAHRAMLGLAELGFPLTQTKVK